jgi:SAM-dependent methyltransferase
VQGELFGIFAACPYRRHIRITNFLPGGITMSQVSESPDARPVRKRWGTLLVVAFLCVGGGLLVRQALLTAASRTKVSQEKVLPLGREGHNAPFIVSPDPAVETMVAHAGLKPDDVVYDLGCGDGRLVIAAVRHTGCTGVGFDIDPNCVREAQENALRQGVADRVQIVEQDIFTVDLSKSSVAMLYLLPWMINKLVPQFEQMKPGSRIVSHEFWLPGCEPDQVIRVPMEADANEPPTIYLYTCPLRKNPKLLDRPPRAEDYPPQKAAAELGWRTETDPGS